MTFPKNLNNISDVCEDAIRKMLIVDPKKRIEWEDLFNHPINHYLEDKIKNDLNQTLKADGDINMNMSKFYIKNNLCINHPTDI